MKMKKTLSIILGGALLVGSSSFIFANDALQLKTEVQDQSAVSSEVSVEVTESESEAEAEITTQTPKVTIEVLNEVIDNLDTEFTIDTDDEDFYHELLRLLENILSQLEQVNTKIDEKSTENNEDLTHNDEVIDEEIEIEIEDEDEDDNKDEQLALENLYRKLLKYQLVYDKVPTQAKPAIEKNIKNMQLKIVEYALKTNIDLNTFIPEFNSEEVQSELSILKEQLESEGLTEEGKQELMDAIAELEKKISSHEEMVQLVEFVSENENWKNELKNKIHQEFKEDKAQVKIDHKLAKEEIKIARKKAKAEAKRSKAELKAKMKSNKEYKKIEEKAIELEKKALEKAFELEKKSNEKFFEAKKKTNEKIFEAEKKANERNIKNNEKISKNKSHPVKENHPGKGKGKNK